MAPVTILGYANGFKEWPAKEGKPAQVIGKVLIQGSNKFIDCAMVDEGAGNAFKALPPLTPVVIEASEITGNKYGASARDCTFTRQK